MPNTEKDTGIQSVERVAAVLDVVASQAVDGCRLVDIVRGTDLSKATAHRFLRALERVGLVEFDERADRYFIGMRVAALGTAAGNRFGLVQRCQPSLRRLAMRTADTVYLSLRIGDETVCLAREEGEFPIKILTLNVGDRRPLGVGATALALLAFLSDAEIERILAANAAAVRTLGSDSATLLDMVSASRRYGYALNDGRFVAGMHAVALPISGPEGEPIAAIGVAAIDSRMKAERREDIVTWIREEVEKIERDLCPFLRLPSKAARQKLLMGGGSPAPAIAQG
jgi:DNA-binding IclR family transcriptional regulator